MAKRSIAPLVNGRVRLRLLEEADLPATLAWRNHDHIRRWFFHSALISPEQHQAWFEQYRERDDDFVFVIEETALLNRPIGQVALYNIEWAARRGEYGRLMIGDTAARGLGLAKLATTALVEEAMNSWGLAEVYLEVLSSNASAISVYRSCGFIDAKRNGDAIVMRRTAS